MKIQKQARTMSIIPVVISATRGIVEGIQSLLLEKGNLVLEQMQKVVLLSTAQVVGKVLTGDVIPYQTFVTLGVT